MSKLKGQEFNNRSQGQRLRYNRERSKDAVDIIESHTEFIEKQNIVNQEMYALLAQNERSNKALNARVTSVERQVRKQHEQDRQSW